MKIIWNIKPLKRKGVETGEIKIWTEVPEAYGPKIVLAVNLHDEMLYALKAIREFKDWNACKDLIGKTIAKAEAL